MIMTPYMKYKLINKSGISKLPDDVINIIFTYLDFGEQKNSILQESFKYGLKVRYYNTQCVSVYASP